MTMSVEAVERIYSRYSGVYDFFFGRIFHSGREQAVECMDLQPGERVLEVGVGTGLSLPFYPRHGKVVGIDISDEMLEEARKRVAQENMRHVTLQRMDAMNMEFPDNSFDVVLAAYVVTTVPDPYRMVAEIKRVCKPGARVVFLNHFRSTKPVLKWLEKVISPLTWRIGFRTDLDLAHFVQEAQLQVARVQGVNLFDHWKIVECANR